MPRKDADPDIAKVLSEIKDDIKTVRDSQAAAEITLSDINKKLDLQQKELDDVKDRVSDIERKLNDREQHSRNFSIRIFKLALPAGTAQNSMLTADYVYQKVLLPILNHAVSLKSIPAAPSLLQLIEHCHVLPTKNSSDTVPILVRFQSRLMKEVIMRNKKSVMPADPELKTVSICEDLTAANFAVLKDLHKKNIKAWSLSGKIFYMKDGEKKLARY